MPLQNRVTPLGEVIATPERGLVYANRGCLHDAHGRVRERRNPTRRWIACRLEWGGRRRTPLMAPGKFTELFFLDEATALAAGHRPCGECRYGDYEHLKGLWADLHPGQVGADAIDEQLDAERRDPRTGARRFHETDFDDLPDGAFVMLESEPHLVLGRDLLRWSPAGYTARMPAPRRRPERRRRWRPRWRPWWRRDCDHATVARRAARHRPHPARPAPAPVGASLTGQWVTTGDSRSGCSSKAGPTP